MTLAAPRSRQSRLTLALAILAATVALGGGLLFWSSNASADINTAAVSVAQTGGPNPPQPGDLVQYTYTLSGATGGNVANTELIVTVDGGIPNSTNGSNANIEVITGTGIFSTAGECTIDGGAKEAQCLDPTGSAGAIAGTTVVIDVRVLPAQGGDDELNPPGCLLQDAGSGSANCTTNIVTVPIDTGAPDDATNPPGVPHVFTFVLADGVTCESDLVDNDGLRSCDATDVDVQGCTLDSGPTVADTDLTVDSDVTVTISSATEQTCTVTLALKFDPQTCTAGPQCTGATFVDISDVSATKEYTLGEPNIRHLDIPDAATEDESNDQSAYCSQVSAAGPPQVIDTCGLLDDVHDADDATGSFHGACIEGSSLTFEADGAAVTWHISPINGGPNPVAVVPFAGPFGEPCVRWSAATVGSQSIYATYDADGPGGAAGFDIYFDTSPHDDNGNTDTPVPLPLVKEWNDIDFTEIVSVSGNVGDNLGQNTGELAQWGSRDCYDSNDSYCARPNQDGQLVLQGGVAIAGGGYISAPGRSFIEYVYGNHNTNGGAYPDPQSPETGAECLDALDNDNDGNANDGCPTIGTPETGNAVGPAAPGNCDNMADDDQDGRINDGCPAVSVGPVDGVEQTFSTFGSCGSVRLEDPTSGAVHILSTNSSETVLSSDKGVGFQILPNSTGAIATTLENADCGPNAEVCVSISSEEENLFRSPPIDDADSEEVCVRFVVGPPTNKTPVLAWAGQRVMVEADWASYAVGDGEDRVCPDYDGGIGDPDEFGVLYTLQHGEGGFTAALVGNPNDVDQVGSDVITDVNHEAVDEDQNQMTDPNSDCISRVIYEQQGPGQVDIIAYPVDDNDSLSDADPRGQQQAFVIYYMKLEDITLGLVPGERTGHNSGSLTGNSNPFDTSDDETEVDANVSADVLARVRIRGWVLTDNCPVRDSGTGANGEFLPANRCIFPDDWRMKAGGDLAEEFRPNFDTLGGSAVGCDSESGGAAGPFSLLDRVASHLNPLRLSPPFGPDPDAAQNSNPCGDSLAPHVNSNGQPCRSDDQDTSEAGGQQNDCRETVFPNGSINAGDAQMPPALIRFLLSGSGFLTGTDKNDVYSGPDDNFYVTHIPAEPWIAPINADLSGYQWDTWGGFGGRSGLYEYWNSLAETGAEVISCPGQSPCDTVPQVDGNADCPADPITNPSINPGCETGGYKMTKVYSDNRGEAMTWINGDADLTFEDCLTGADVPTARDGYVIKVVQGFFCEPDDVVGHSTLTAAADYPDKRKHFPIDSNDVAITWLWGGEKTVTVDASANDQIHTIEFRATDRDGFCDPSPSFHPVYGERVDFLIDSGDGTIISITNFGIIADHGQSATTTTYDPITSPDEDVCIAGIDVLSTLIAEVDVFITAYDPEGTVSFDVILNPDQDGDGVVDDDDNCVDTPNSDQNDADDDDIGDACDTESGPGSDDCTDGVDNDGDGDVDALDSGCQEQEGPPGDASCSDGIDNDGDFLIDDADPGCVSSALDLIWGDSDCDNDVSTRDSQALLRRVLDQPALSQDAPCFALGTNIEVEGHDDGLWGDWDCDGDITTRDSQAVLRNVLNQSPLTQSGNCAAIGDDVSVTGP